MLCLEGFFFFFFFSLTKKESSCCCSQNKVLLSVELFKPVCLLLKRGAGADLCQHGEQH